MASSPNSVLQTMEGPVLGARIGRVRWTICAMLFAATTINYMDRQVLALLKPTLMLSVAHHGIGLTEESYGTVVSFFTLFYALGQLGVGRFVDKVGTRLGYIVIMALWSLSAMGHALVNSVLQLGIARSCLGIGESGNFPAANKTVAEWFPQKERSLAFGIFNCGANVGVILASLLVPLAVRRIRLAFGLSDHRILLVLVDRDVVLQIPKTCRASRAIGSELAPHQPGSPRKARSIHAVDQALRHSVRPGPMPFPNSSPIPSGGSISTGCRVTSAINFI